MSDMLSHWAIFEDLRKIAAHDARFDLTLNEVIDKHLEFARLGTVSRGGNKWMQPIMERAKARWDDPSAHPAQDRKLAFALGGLPHQAIDNVVKPYRSLVAERNDQHEQPLEFVHRWLYAYQDAFLFRRVFNGGADGDGFFNPYLLAENSSDLGRAVEAFSRSLVLRSLQGVHTIAPNIEDMDAWLDRATDIIQPVTVDIERLVEAFVRPDPDKLARFRLEEEFYSTGDPAVALAEKTRAGGVPLQPEIDAAVEVDRNQSIYGQALAVGIRYMREGARFWRGETDSLDTPNFDTTAFWTSQAEKGRQRRQEVTASK